MRFSGLLGCGYLYDAIVATPDHYYISSISFIILFHNILHDLLLFLLLGDLSASPALKLYEPINT